MRGRALLGRKLRRQPVTQLGVLGRQLIEKILLDAEGRIRKHRSSSLHMPAVRSHLAAGVRIHETAIPKARRLGRSLTSGYQAALELAQFPGPLLVELPARIRPPAEHIELDEHAIAAVQLITTERPA